ncbi:MAG: IgGFc-binding protein [Myxococcales bacterium]|mgnify:CR=1 FL=1|nr:IgGFc-binding protein [Myxococcales bacterium]
MRRPIIAVLLLVSAAWVGCSSGRDGWKENDSLTFAPDAGADVDVPCSGLSCSRDLRSVLDCSGGLVKECAADLACGNGECVDPCTAAALNEGSVGCSFAVPGANDDGANLGSCSAIFVANTWTSPATLRLEYQGEERSLDGAVWLPSVENGIVKYTKVEGPIPPAGGAVVFLSAEDHSERPGWVGCPEGVKPVFDKALALLGTGIGYAPLVRSDIPVSMYSIYPYGGASSHSPSATLLLPTTSFRKNYVLMSSWGGKGDVFGKGVFAPPGGATTQVGKPTIQIVAAEDDTSIDLLPKVDIVGAGGIPAGARNEVASYRLRRGEMLQLIQENELVGSVMETSKPVGVFGGHTSLNVPADITFADSDNSQITPVSAWGREYAVLPAPNRTNLMSRGVEKERDPSPIRLVAAVNDTQLVYEPSRPVGAPERLDAGQLAVFFANEPFVVRSQDASHPFVVAVLMTGTFASSYNIGDPETALAVATDQWLDTYGFFSDFTYDSSSVFVTRRKVSGVFRDVTLDCAGVLTGWRSITDDYEWTYAELTRRGESQMYPAGECTDGAHRIHSEGPFSITVWGMSRAASYAYPGGMGLRRITEVNVPVR